MSITQSIDPFLARVNFDANHSNKMKEGLLKKSIETEPVTVICRSMEKYVLVAAKIV